MSGTTDIKLLAKIARMYYEEDMTQAAIARKLNMSRSLVSKLLQKQGIRESLRLQYAMNRIVPIRRWRIISRKSLVCLQ